MSDTIKMPSEMTAKEFQDFIEMEPEHTEKSEDGDYLHVPIGFLEPDLRNTFEGKINIKIKAISEMFGSVTICIRIKVYHPVHKIWLKYDGVASVLIESEKPGEYKGAIKVQIMDDMKTAVAACYSEAIKNAAKKIGKRFGSDLNRINKPGKPKADKAEVKKKAVDNRVVALINDAETIADLNNLIKDLPQTDEVQKALNKKLTELKKRKK